MRPEKYDRYRKFNHVLKKHLEHMKKENCDKCYLKFEHGDNGISLNDRIGWYGSSSVSKSRIFETEKEMYRMVVNFLNKNKDELFLFVKDSYKEESLSEKKDLKEEIKRLQKIIEEMEHK